MLYIVQDLLSLSQTAWPWYVSGPAIALVMGLLLWAGGEFGVSSTMRTLCSVAGAGKRVSFFDFDWKGQIWNIVFILGSVIGGFLASQFLMSDSGIQISEATQNDLRNLGIQFEGSLVPEQLFNWDSLLSIPGILFMVLGGFLVGFGARYAGGCTSGHAISGLSNFQLPSLVAVIGFFMGGIIANWLILPYILKLFI